MAAAAAAVVVVVAAAEANMARERRHRTIESTPMKDDSRLPLLGRLQRRQARPRGTELPEGSEAGFTLVELLVVMPFLIIVTALVMWSLVDAYGAGSEVQSTSQSSSEVTLAFMTLEGEIRYAADINEPGNDTNSPPDYYVEFESTWTQNTLGYSQCTELEYTSGGVLQQLQWNAADSAPTTGWKPLASGLETTTSLSDNPFYSSSTASTDPFYLSSPQDSPWELSFYLTAVTGSGSTKGNAQSEFTITSLDTTESSVSQDVCGGTP